MDLLRIGSKKFKSIIANTKSRRVQRNKQPILASCRTSQYEHQVNAFPFLLLLRVSVFVAVSIVTGLALSSLFSGEWLLLLCALITPTLLSIFVDSFSQRDGVCVVKNRWHCTQLAFGSSAVRAREM